ncbi:HD domain-containing protein [Anaerostipes caccae]|jgi:(p)ppGpp synthase/HD superfamily hydrolase|nr:HD domain-containing protein [Anaerostipes caccae]MCB7189766.1 HD domain-containing protein [Anaerostipes caccae]
MIYDKYVNTSAKKEKPMFEKAIIFATKAHSGQKRKGTDIPFMIHPLEVASIVAGITPDEDMMCAAVLHDVIEDCRDVTGEDIRREFGDKVADYVLMESEDKSRSWIERKRHTVDFLKHRAKRPAKVIALGDKLANVRSLARDYKLLGDELWQRFNMKDKNMQGWYYKSMIECFKEFSDYHEYNEYCCLVEQVFKDTIDIDIEDEKTGVR